MLPTSPHARRRGTLAAAEHAHRALTAVCSLSTVAVDTWGAAQTDMNLRITAATTARLLRTEIAGWDHHDVKHAKSHVKMASRLLHEPRGVLRDARLRALGVDPDAGPHPVEWVDRENVLESTRANAVALAATRCGYVGRQAATYVTMHAGTADADAVARALTSTNWGHAAGGATTVLTVNTPHRE